MTSKAKGLGKMAEKKPLFEGTVAELLKEWFGTGVDKHWLDRGGRRIIIYQAPKAWEKLVEQNGDKTEAKT